jgi:hypothetical protein
MSFHPSWAWPLTEASDASRRLSSVELLPEAVPAATKLIVEPAIAQIAGEFGHSWPEGLS